LQSIKELPGSVSVPSTSDFGTAPPLSTIPGSENEFKQDQRPLARGADFIRGGPANDWIESFRPPGVPEFGGAESQYAEFDQIYNNAGTTIRPPLDGRCPDFSFLFFFFDLMFVCVLHCTNTNLILYIIHPTCRINDAIVYSLIIIILSVRYYRLYILQSFFALCGSYCFTSGILPTQFA
jgi:hypothetical protein